MTPSSDNASGAGNTNRRLGEILVTRGSLAPDQLRRTLRYQAGNGARLGDALQRLGYVNQEQLADALAEQKRLSVVRLHDAPPDLRAVAQLTERFIRARRALPVGFDGDALVVAMVDPLDVLTLDDIRVITGMEIIAVVATLGAFEETVDALFADGSARSTEPTAPEPRPKAPVRREDAEGTTVAALVEGILDTALKRRASDIHLEPQIDDLKVRVRIDGVLHLIAEIPAELQSSVISRIKILGDMDIAERRLPQDGRASYRSAEQNVDLRIASLPSVYGENITIRLLDDSMFRISLEELGMDKPRLDTFREALRRPHGAILVTGPTGSGKSTTLYAALEEIKRPEAKIYTVEDPVERRMAGIVQSQVKPGIGLTFARMLRSLVRSDPDVVMIGEIRDLETATICCEASLTGHLVLSTLHTNDAPATVTRLAEMGVPPYLVASSLECVVAQRLARRLCQRCREEVALAPEQMTATEQELLGKKALCLSRARGCVHCLGTGYSGRVALFEVLPVNRELGRLIRDGAGADDIREYGRGAGMVSLREDGLKKVLDHATTFEEVLRVTA